MAAIPAIIGLVGLMVLALGGVLLVGGRVRYNQDKPAVLISSVGIVLAVMGLSVVASLWLDSIAFLFGLALLIVGSGAYALFRERRDKRESIGADDRP